MPTARTGQHFYSRHSSNKGGGNVAKILLKAFDEEPLLTKVDLDDTLENVTLELQKTLGWEGLTLFKCVCFAAPEPLPHKSKSKDKKGGGVLGKVIKLSQSHTHYSTLLDNLQSTGTDSGRKQSSDSSRSPASPGVSVSLEEAWRSNRTRWNDTLSVYSSNYPTTGCVLLSADQSLSGQGFNPTVHVLEYRCEIPSMSSMMSSEPHGESKRELDAAFLYCKHVVDEGTCVLPDNKLAEAMALQLLCIHADQCNFLSDWAPSDILPMLPKTRRSMEIAKQCHSCLLEECVRGLEHWQSAAEFMRICQQMPSFKGSLLPIKAELPTSAPGKGLEACYLAVSPSTIYHLDMNAYQVLQQWPLNSLSATATTKHVLGLRFGQSSEFWLWAQDCVKVESFLIVKKWEFLEERGGRAHGSPFPLLSPQEEGCKKPSTAGQTSSPSTQQQTTLSPSCDETDGGYGGIFDDVIHPTPAQPAALAPMTSPVSSSVVTSPRTGMRTQSSTSYPHAAASATTPGTTPGRVLTSGDVLALAFSSVSVGDPWQSPVSTVNGSSGTGVGGLVSPPSNGIAPLNAITPRQQLPPPPSLASTASPSQQPRPQQAQHDPHVLQPTTTPTTNNDSSSSSSRSSTIACTNAVTPRQALRTSRPRPTSCLLPSEVKFSPGLLPPSASSQYANTPEGVMSSPGTNDVMLLPSPVTSTPPARRVRLHSSPLQLQQPQHSTPPQQSQQPHHSTPPQQSLQLQQVQHSTPSQQSQQPQHSTPPQQSQRPHHSTPAQQLWQPQQQSSSGSSSLRHSWVAFADAHSPVWQSPSGSAVGAGTTTATRTSSVLTGQGHFTPGQEIASPPQYQPQQNQVSSVRAGQVLLRGKASPNPFLLREEHDWVKMETPAAAADAVFSDNNPFRPRASTIATIGWTA